MPDQFVESIQITTLPNGVRIVSETVPHVQSAAIGIWVYAGSRDESKEVRGISHFIEHMLFKGTGKRTAWDIADAIESRGGSLNAFTDKEYTCYYAKSLAEDAELVIDVLTDMVSNSLLDPEEIAREKNVVIEEIKRYHDTPDDIIHDLFIETLWTTHPLGRPVIGVEQTVDALTRDSLVDYMGRMYTPDRLVVSAAGNLTHAELVEMVASRLGGLSGKGDPKTKRSPKVSGKDKLKRRKTEQIHFCYGTDAYAQGDQNRYTLTIIDSVLGGNMSSRLFQEIREKRGLAYSIGSYSASYREGGQFTIYGGTSPDTFDQVMELTRAEIENVKQNNLTHDEVSKAKTQIKGGMVLGLENMSGRMMRMGKNMLYYNRVLPLDEILGHIQRVSHEDIDRVANTLLVDSKMTLAAIGAFSRPRGAE